MDAESTPILHIDMDAFFASIEERADPRLRGKPLVVGGGPAGREVVTTASYPARRFGLRSGMSLREAMRLCPGVIYRPVDPSRYVFTAQALLRLFESFTPAVEPASIDEVFLDLSGLADTPGRQKELAGRIVTEVARQERLSCSAGLAGNKLQAKMAARLKKPGGLTQLHPGDFQRIFAPRPAIELWGLGPHTAERLASLGIRTIGDLAGAPVPELVRLFGAAGRVLPRMAQGEGGGPIVPYYEAPSARSMGHEMTLAQDVLDLYALQNCLVLLSDRLGRRLRREGFVGHVIVLKLKFCDQQVISRQTSLAWPTDDERDIHQHGRLLLQKHYGELPEADRRPVRLIGISVGHLVGTAGRLPLFPEDQKRRTLVETRDRLRDRFGETVLLPARVWERFKP